MCPMEVIRRLFGEKTNIQYLTQCFRINAPSTLNLLFNRQLKRWLSNTLLLQSDNVQFCCSRFIKMFIQLYDCCGCCRSWSRWTVLHYSERWARYSKHISTKHFGTMRLSLFLSLHSMAHIKMSDISHTGSHICGEADIRLVKKKAVIWNQAPSWAPAGDGYYYYYDSLSSSDHLSS